MKENSKNRVLIVREESCPFIEMREILEKHGFTVYVTDSGQAAMEYIRDIKLDLVLVGVELPDISGYELCRKMKANKNLPDIPVILLSYGEEVKDRLRGFLSGAQQYICKSSSTRDLIKEVLLSIEDKLPMNMRVEGKQGGGMETVDTQINSIPERVDSND